ncbi:MAG: ribonuclease HIII [Fibrobacterota bacterium]
MIHSEHSSASHAEALPGSFSKIDAIDTLVKKYSGQLRSAGLHLSRKQEMPYGTQFRVVAGSREGLINIYFSRKKGISRVDCSQNAVSELALRILSGQADCGHIDDSDEGQEELAFEKWVGTDESGKGDFFGPLVVAGFYVTTDMQKTLVENGVTDSKKLSEEQIRRIAGWLHGEYPEHITVVAPGVSKYNELYVSFGNLNKLLAWAHARCIEDLVRSWQQKHGVQIQGAVADQFGDKKYITNALSSMKQIRLVQRHRGESNVAVAAASIIARNHFAAQCIRMEQNYGVKFPLGCSAQVKAAAKQFVQRYGKQRLSQVAKVHFKTYQEI